MLEDIRNKDVMQVSYRSDHMTHMILNYAKIIMITHNISKLDQIIEILNRIFWKEINIFRKLFQIFWNIIEH